MKRVTNWVWNCGGAEYARSNNIPVIVFPKTKQISDSLSLNDLIATLRRCEIDFILLAGYLKLIPDELVRAYPKSILNIHPSLLPAFGGKAIMGSKFIKFSSLQGLDTLGQRFIL